MGAFAAAASGIASTAAPVMSATAIRNENSVAASGAIPRASATATVVPLREIPGAIAITCAQPITKACVKVGAVAWAVSRVRRVDSRITPVTSKAIPTTRGSPNKDSMKSFAVSPATTAGRGGHDELADVDPGLPIRGQGPANQPQDPLTIEGQNGHECADVDSDLEQDTLIHLTEQMLRDDQMARARDRPELGETLDNPQEGSFDEIQKSSRTSRQNRPPWALAGVRIGEKILSAMGMMG